MVGVNRRKSQAYARGVSGEASDAGIARRRTLRRAERVGLVEKKQLPFCTRLSYEFSTGIQRSFRKLREGSRNLQIWGGAIKEVEGNLGSGVSTYFRVLRWLLKINLVTMLLGLGLVVVPGIYMHETHDFLVATSYNKDDLVGLIPQLVLLCKVISTC